MRDRFPWSMYTLPSGCKVFLTSRPDRYVDNTFPNTGLQGLSFTELFGAQTGHKYTIRLSHTDDYIKGPVGERHVWIPWFVDQDKRENPEPTLSSIATFITQLRHYESPNGTIWVHCDSSSMRAPTYFGLFLNGYYNDQIDAILDTLLTNMPENYHWSSPKEYAEMALKRSPMIRTVLDQIKEKL